MKDYEHVVIWLDYFNKTLPRSKGRRAGKEMCVFDPSLAELVDAAKAAGFEVSGSEDSARYPRRPYVRSGYVSIPKGPSKTAAVRKISEKLLAKRAKQHK